MKAAGIEYEQRIEELESWSGPSRTATSSTRRSTRSPIATPGSARRTCGPKSVAREMYEGFASFDDYVRSYGLERSEGVLLRYLSQVYKTMAETVPLPARSEEVMDILAHFRTLLRDVDTSLIEEWESLTQPGRARPAPGGRAAGRRSGGGAAGAVTPRSAPSCTSWCARSRGATTRRRVRLLAPGRGEPWTAERLDRGDGAVLGGAHRAADDARRAPRPTARASTSSTPGRCASSRRWSTPRATRTGRSTASSTSSRRARPAITPAADRNLTAAAPRRRR